MINIEIQSNNFSIYYKNHLFFKHSPALPMLTIGKGTGYYRSQHGNFKIKEKIDNKQPLAEFKVLKNSSQEVVIDFSSQIELRLADEQGKLVISFNPKSSSINRLWLKLQSSQEEKIYGCGEQYSKLNLKGKKVPLWCEEQGVGRGKDLVTLAANIKYGAGGKWYSTYYPQPTFVSSANYYLHTDQSAYALFDFSQPEFHELYYWEVPERIILNKLDTACQILSELSLFLGRQPALPEWVYAGVCLGLQGGTSIVEKKLNTALKAGIEVAAIWAQDWEGKRITGFGKQLMWNWKYDQEMYPDLPAYIKELNKRGVKLLGYINPFLAIEKDLYQEAHEKGYLVQNQDNEDYLITVTTFPAALIDLSNPEAFQWIKEVIKKHMIGIGLSGWMADYAEYLPIDAKLRSGESAETFHNQYPVMWARANREAIAEMGLEKEISFFSRSGYSYSSRYSPMIWAGDQLVNWSINDGLASVIPAGISLGFSGIGIFHSDVGGFTTFAWVKRSKELLLRWIDLAAFMPLMRFHEGNRPDNNWQFDSDQETLHHLARMSRINKQLKPYFKKSVQEYVDHGLPLMRHPYIHYEKDLKLHDYQYQFLIGRDLFYAPVYQKGKVKQNLYLPDDNWIHLWSGQPFNGGNHTIPARPGKPPLFYRHGSGYTSLFEQLKND